MKNEAFKQIQFLVSTLTAFLKTILVTEPADQRRLNAAGEVFAACDTIRQPLSESVVIGASIRQSLSYLQDALSDLSSNEPDMEEDEEDGHDPVRDACQPLLIVCRWFVPFFLHLKGLVEAATKSLSIHSSLDHSVASQVSYCGVLCPHSAGPSRRQYCRSAFRSCCKVCMHVLTMSNRQL